MWNAPATTASISKPRTTDGSGLAPLPRQPDRLLRFAFPRERVRGQIIRLEQAWGEVARRHRQHEGREISPNLRQRLGELSAAGLLLSASLKFDGSLVLQIQSQGPVSLFVVECEQDARFRATVKIREGQRIMPDASLTDLLGPLRQARFAVTLLPRSDAEGATGQLSAPYQGIVPFEGDTLAELLENYMARSEQIPTRLWLAADEESAFGLLLQRLPASGGHGDDDDGQGDDSSDFSLDFDFDVAPGSDSNGVGSHDGGSAADHDAEAPDSVSGGDGDADPDAGWRRIVALADQITRRQMLEVDLEPLVRRAFASASPHIFHAAAPRFVCNCSRHKVESMLRLLGEAEIREIVREQGLVEVRCEFCGEEYLLGADEARRLFNDAGNDDRGDEPLIDLG